MSSTHETVVPGGSEPTMTPLRFCANISWLFTELPHLSQRIYAAAAAGFRAVEVAWPYDSDVQELRRAIEATALEVVLINTPPGKHDSTNTHSDMIIHSGLKACGTHPLHCFFKVAHRT